MDITNFNLRLTSKVHCSFRITCLLCVILPLVPQYEVVASIASLLQLDTMLSLLGGVGLALLLAH